jgi:predicted nucleic acid-binding protein
LTRDLLLDTSVLLKWFHRDGEDEIEQAEWHLQAHRQGIIRAHVLDLGMYELGNVLVRPLKRSATECAAVLNAASALCGPPLTLSPADLAEGAAIACAGGLTFYDAAFAVAASAHDCTLISADRRLLATGHAITLTQSMAQLRGQQ